MTDQSVSFSAVIRFLCIICVFIRDEPFWALFMCFHLKNASGAGATADVESFDTLENLLLTQQHF